MKNYKILFLGETYRADALTWIKGIEKVSGLTLDTKELPAVKNRLLRGISGVIFLCRLVFNSIFRKYDMVLAERSTSYGFFSLFVRSKIRIVAQQGATDLFPGTGLALQYKGMLQRIVYKNCNLIHAWGQAIADHILVTGVPESKILIMPKGIPVNKFTFIDRSKLVSIPFHVIVTRSLESYYGHRDIIKAVRKIVDNGYSIKLTIVGDGTLRRDLEVLVSELEINQYVQFTGRVANDSLPDLLSSNPIYLSAPMTEGYSGSLIEAMACGCLPVVTDLKANRYLINDGQNGFLFESGKSDSIATALIKAYIQFKNMFAGIRSNRQFVEDKNDMDQNMKVFWQKYVSLI